MSTVAVLAIVLTVIVSRPLVAILTAVVSAVLLPAAFLTERAKAANLRRKGSRPDAVIGGLDMLLNVILSAYVALLVLLVAGLR